MDELPFCYDCNRSTNSGSHEWCDGISRVDTFARAFCLFLSGNSLNLSAQDVATCKGSAELEQTIKAHPSAGAYDALGAYFGQRQKISCAISAFESAVHLDPNLWKPLQPSSRSTARSNQPTRAVRELTNCHPLQPENPTGHIALGVALSR